MITSEWLPINKKSYHYDGLENLRQSEIKMHKSHLLGGCTIKLYFKYQSSIQIRKIIIIELRTQDRAKNMGFEPHIQHPFLLSLAEGTIMQRARGLRMNNVKKKLHAIIELCRRCFSGYYQERNYNLIQQRFPAGPCNVTISMNQ